MNANTNDTSRAERDVKAGILTSIQAPYWPLLGFLRQAPAMRIRAWARAAPLYDPDFWNRQSGDIRCLSYAFNKLLPGVNTEDLNLKRLWDVANPPEEAKAIIERYAAFQRKIEYQFVQPYTGASMAMPQWAESKIDNMREVFTHLMSFNFKVIEKPEQLTPGTRLIALGLLPQKFVLKGSADFPPAEHYARLDATGHWSEKPGEGKVINAGSSDPLALTTWSVPTCFLQAPPQNTL